MHLFVYVIFTMFLKSMCVKLLIFFNLEPQSNVRHKTSPQLVTICMSHIILEF